MSRKDYILLAETVKEEKAHLERIECNGDERAAALNGLVSFTTRLAGRLQFENARFDRARFLAACGF